MKKTFAVIVLAFILNACATTGGGVSERDPNSATAEARAGYESALALHLSGKSSDALAELAKIPRRSAGSILRLKMDSLGAYASKAAGQTSKDSMEWPLFLLDDYAAGASYKPSSSAEKIVPEKTALSIVKKWMEDQSITVGDVEALPLKAMRGRRSGGFAEFKLAETLHRTGETKAAAARLKNYVRAYPKHEYYGPAMALLGESGGEFGAGAGISIGLIAPLTGKNAVYGESVLHGVECALGVFEPCTGPAGMKVVVRDSNSAPDGAATLVDQLASEGVAAIVGPLVSADAESAARRAEELRIPIISLSQQKGIAEIGDFTFKNSISPESEVAALVDFAVGRRKLKNFLVLYPASKMGTEYKDIFSQEVREKGGRIVEAKPYSPNQMDVSNELRNRGASENGGAADIVGGAAGFDAVFIPDSYWAGVYIASQLALTGGERVQFLGASRWNDPGLVERGGEYVEGAVFTDTFYKKSSDEAISSFVNNFRGAYGMDPTLLEALGYDSARMIVLAVRDRGAASREMVRDVLSKTSGFAGAAGRTSFDAAGNARRKPWVLTVKEGAIKPAD